MNLSQIFSMGGYAAYVWPAYCITLLVFGINFFSAITEKRKIKSLLKQHITHE